MNEDLNKEMSIDKKKINFVEIVKKRMRKSKAKFAEKMKERKVQAEIKKKKIAEIRDKAKKENDVDPTFVEQTKEQIKEQKKEGGLTSEVSELNKKIESLIDNKKYKKNKQFKLPYKIRKDLKKLAQKNKLMVIMLRRNRNMDPIISEIKNGFTYIDGVPHNCSLDFIFLWKGKYPAIIQPEWDLNPIGTESYYNAVNEGRAAEPVATVLRMIKDKEILTKTPTNMKTWIFIGLAIIAGVYVLMGNS